MGLFPLEYECQSCGHKTDSSKMNAMVCECGGNFRNTNHIGVPATTFDAGWCPTLKQYVHSWSDQEKKAKAFRSADHPEGFTLLQGNKKYMKHLKNVYKNREDVKAEQYGKDGIKYPKGKEVYFHPQENRFIDKKTKAPIETKRYSVPTKPTRISEKIITAAVFMIGISLAASTASAKIENVPYVTLEVKGVSYEVPIHAPDFYEPDAKLVMDVLDGDKNARKVFLRGKKERIFFIGDGEKIRWLHVTEKNEWVDTL